MNVRKKRPSAADVLRQEMQQPLVLPDRAAAGVETSSNSSQPNSPTIIPTMNPPNSDDAAAAKLKTAQENEAKLQKQIEELQSKLEQQTTSAKKLETKTETLTKELKEAKETALKLSSTPAKSTAKSTAIVKTDSAAARSSLTARPTESREQTALRRANTDIGWLD